VGVSVDSPDSDTARFSTKPESALATSSLVDTGTLGDVERIGRAGLEGLWISGPVSLQGEVAAVDARRTGAPDLRGVGGYALASWSPSGHRRNYKAGTVSSPTLGDGMAWEFVLRYSALDLDSSASRGGVESDWNVGATWYPSPYARVMANYVVADSRRRGVNDDPRLFQMRLQLQF
jgi:phosphate-selective porin OprO/OprP